MLTCVFETFVKVSVDEFGTNPLYCVSLPGYTWQCSLEIMDIKLQTLQDKDMTLLLENKIRSGISSVMGDRYVKLVYNERILYADAINSNGWAILQSLPHDETKFETCVRLEDILNTPDDNDFGYFPGVDLKCPDNIKDRTNNFPFFS